MLPIQKILYATDFSGHSRHALHLACSLARDYSAKLVVLHALPRPTVAYAEGVIPPDPVSFRREYQDKLNGLEIPDRNISVERRLTEGDPATEILAAAKDIDADLIVLGTHGRTGLMRLLMGSVAEHVVRHATCPVLTVSGRSVVRTDETAELPAQKTPKPAITPGSAGDNTVAVPAWATTPHGTV